MTYHFQQLQYYRQKFAPAVLSALLSLITVPSWSQSAEPTFHQSDLPEIGNPADRYMSPAQEIKLGEEFFRSVYRAGAVLEDPEIASYIQHLGNTLSNTLGSGEHTFTFFVVKDNAINAFAVPGGYVGVNAGLILASETESQLASVIAHEIAHISQRHIARRIASMSETKIPTLAAVLAGMLLAAGGAGDAGTAVIASGVAMQQQQFLSFSRDNEIEADRIGLDILYNTGFDPTGMPEFFRTLQRQRFSPNMRQFAFLLTHPLDHVRIAEAQGRINRLPKQQHANSSHYLYARARLQALASDQPVELVRNLEKSTLATDKPEAYVLGKYAYSQALERAAEYTSADKTLNQINGYDHESIPLQLARVRSLINSKQTDSALKILQQLKTIYPDNFSVNYYYAKALLDAKQFKQGAQLLKKHLLKNPAPIMSVYKLLAELYDADGQSIESKKTLSDYYFNTGNFNGAVFKLREILEDPNIDYVTRSQIEVRLRELTQMLRS